MTSHKLLIIFLMVVTITSNALAASLTNSTSLNVQSPESEAFKDSELYRGVNDNPEDEDEDGESYLEDSPTTMAPNTEHQTETVVSSTILPTATHPTYQPLRDAVVHCVKWHTLRVSGQRSINLLDPTAPSTKAFDRAMEHCLFAHRAILIDDEYKSTKEQLSYAE